MNICIGRTIDCLIKIYVHTEFIKFVKAVAKKPKWNQLFEFSLNVFTECSEFSVKIILYFRKNIQTYHLLCKRPRSYHSASKTQVTDRIYKLNPIHALVIYQIP